MWVLWEISRSSGRAAGALNHWASSSPHLLSFYLFTLFLFINGDKVSCSPDCSRICHVLQIAWLWILPRPSPDFWDSCCVPPCLSLILFIIYSLYILIGACPPSAILPSSHPPVPLLPSPLPFLLSKGECFTPHPFPSHHPPHFSPPPCTNSSWHIKSHYD